MRRHLEGQNKGKTYLGGSVGRGASLLRLYLKGVIPISR
jgi:hypothetical protein